MAAVMERDVLQFDLSTLPDELLLTIFAHLDIPDLLAASRTNHRLRRLSLDPILHAHRLQIASDRLSLILAHRPSLSALTPPIATIYLTHTNVLARYLSRRFVAIRLNRNLSRRPSISNLISNNIVPGECYRCDKVTGELIWGGGVAPTIVNVKRKVERERVKDGLRAWLERKAQRVELLQCGADGKERLSVRWLVQRFTASRRGNAALTSAEPRWGRYAAASTSKSRLEPTRAHVLGLRRYWEGIASSQGLQT